ncbi:hypothetical protein F503_01089 [Ophiostoma piceae UAMH 11346]|uniref:Uncharacterized protein n=1 Tax=Ophiostoma piceae (strain UAMH 11346) TaxID=1262450 RepID=S3C8P1_OPHP1|nr:hypothetical protein F503_01089 [Ophiostoma piceae UAMH 11346]
MTRVTAPMSKLTRSLASHPSVARPAYLASTPSHHHNASGRSDLEREDNNRHFTMTHRPTPQPVPSRNRVVPLMQTFNFNTSAPKSARLDTSTIDYFVIPSLGSAADGRDAIAPVRVPLLPDNFHPERENIDGHAPEVGDGPVARPEIVIVAADPSTVSPASALTEIEGMGIDGVALNFAHIANNSGAPSSSTESAESHGMIRDLWKGLVDDFAPATKTA